MPKIEKKKKKTCLQIRKTRYKIAAAGGEKIASRATKR